MAFSIEWSEEAVACLYQLGHEESKQLVKKLEEAAGNPQHFFKRLAGRQEWKLRAGDYRLIARIFLSEKRIFIMSLGHRKNVYKKM